LIGTSGAVSATSVLKVDSGGTGTSTLGAACQFWAMDDLGTSLKYIDISSRTGQTTVFCESTGFSVGTVQNISTTSNPLFNQVNVSNTGLRAYDTNTSHFLIFAPGSDLTANRTLTVTTGDSNRTLTLTGDASITGTNTGDQTITLTGDVTGSGTGSFNVTSTNRFILLSGAGGWPSITSGASGPNRQEFGTNKQNIVALDFSDSNSKLYAEWSVLLPTSYVSSTVTANFVWFATSTATSSTVWGIQAVAYPDSSTIDAAFGPAVTTTDAHSSTANQVMRSATSTAISIAGTPGPNNWVQFRVYRDSSDASDTLAQTASLLGVQINY